MLTPTAWAFTRLGVLGVWRYLKNISEVISPRFLFVYKPKNLGLKKS